MRQLFASGGLSTVTSASASILPMNIQSWFPLELNGLISLLSEGHSRVFSSTTVWKHQFFSAQLSLWSKSHIHAWLYRHLWAKRCVLFNGWVILHCMDVRVELWRIVSAKEFMLLNCGVGKDSWESPGLQGDSTSPFWRRSTQGFLCKEWCWSWNSSTLATSCEELTHWERPWCWEGLRAGGQGDNRGWDGWMASLTRWM